MDLTAADEKLLKALAIAIVDHPRATFKEIAQAAGVSKATLNRFCGTRDNLIEMLLNHGSVVIYRVIADADLEAAPLDALHRLIEGHLIHRELLVFLSFQWRPDTFDLDAGGCRWLPACPQRRIRSMLPRTMTTSQAFWNTQSKHYWRRDHEN